MTTPEPRPPGAALLELDAVTKRYPGVVALERVSFALRAGEVHALVGENGAGKSTLVNLLCGLIRPDEGEIRLDGRPLRLASPIDARRRGIVVVHQEVDVFEPLSVAESMALAGGLPTRLGFVRRGLVRREAEAAVAALPERVDVRAPAGGLGVARRQMIAVASAVSKRARVVLLDEPTSSLSGRESEWLFEQARRLRADGVGVLYISHRPEEILRLADRVTVLRDGRAVWSGDAGELDRSALIRRMVGREETAAAPRAASAHAGPAVLEATVDGVSLRVAAGEILGVYGLVGSGRTEWARAVCGLDDPGSAQVAVDGRAVAIRSPVDAVRAGIVHLPEDRLRQGIFPGLSIRANLVIGALERVGVGPLALAGAERRAAAEPMRATGVKARSLEQPIRELSGGNQQKVVFGRGLLARPRVLILDEPTRGVDLGAKAEIHRLIRDFADGGAGVVAISSELPEILALSDRVAVFREGKVAATFDRSEATAEAVASAALPNEVKSTTARTRGGLRSGRSGLGPALAILALGATLALTTGGRFSTAANLTGLLSNASVLVVLALGSATVMIAGGIDISVGSLLALSAAVGALVLRGTDSVAAGVGAGLLTGAAGGGINAGIALVGRIHPVVVTLGMMTVYRGVLLVLTGGDVIGGLPESFRTPAIGVWRGVPGSVWITAAVVVVAWGFLVRTAAGRRIHAVGANPRGARLAGLSRAGSWPTAFAFGGAAAALAGLLELAQNGSMQSMMGQGYELKGITAAVVGGVAVSGGRGTVGGVVLGAILLTLLQNALVLWSVSRHHYDLFVGGLLLAAVLLDRWTRRADR